MTDEAAARGHLELGDVRRRRADLERDARVNSVHVDVEQRSREDLAIDRAARASAGGGVLEPQGAELPLDARTLVTAGGNRQRGEGNHGEGEAAKEHDK